MSYPVLLDINITTSSCFLTHVYFYCCFAAPVLRLEIYLFSSKLGLLDIKALLLLLDHNSLSGSLDYRTRKMFDLLNDKYVSTLLARRGKVSYVDAKII